MYRQNRQEDKIAAISALSDSVSTLRRYIGLQKCRDAVELIKSELKSNAYKKIVIFEPHRFTRTRDCWDQFLHCFNDADELYLLPIYAASERQIDGISTERLIEDINRIHPMFAKKLNSIDELAEIIESKKATKTIIVTLGAGSIGKAARKWAGLD